MPTDGTVISLSAVLLICVSCMSALTCSYCVALSHSDSCHVVMMSKWPLSSCGRSARVNTYTRIFVMRYCTWAKMTGKLKWWIRYYRGRWRGVDLGECRRSKRTGVYVDCNMHRIEIQRNRARRSCVCELPSATNATDCCVFISTEQ